MLRISLALMVLLVACGDDDGVDPPPDGGPSRCMVAADCSDGLFCNGAEVCDPTNAAADARGCVASTDPCIGDTTCSESEARCITNCDRTDDADADGSISIDCGGDDCNDADPNTYPGNTEVCDDGHDEDCDPTTVGPDSDGDGYQQAGCCNGAVCGRDCGDESSAISPEGIEVCNGFDDDCDSTFDEGVERVHFRDVDGDGFGDNASSTMRACIEDPLWTQTGDDCDDRDRTVFPGAPQLCDGIDNDCNGSDDPDTDNDRDGHLRTDVMCEGDVLPLDDCDDTDPLVYGGALERCNGVDDDCDGVLDEGANAWCTMRARATGDTDALGSCGINAGIARCVVSACGELRADCDGLLGNGCEVDLGTDSTNCGRCGVACESGMCDSGLCVPTFAPSETFVSLEASAEGVCGITSEGHAGCWGETGLLTSRRVRLLDDAAGPIEDVIDVANGDRCICVLQASGQVSCEGVLSGVEEESVGMCALFGEGGGLMRMAPIPGLDDVVDITHGSDHACVVRGANREVWCVGEERLLGTSDGEASDVLVQVGVLGGGVLDQVTQIDAGDVSTCAVRNGTDVFCWGENFGGVLGRGGSATPTGTGLLAAPIATAVEFDRVEVGARHGCAINASNEVYCWGLEEAYNGSGFTASSPTRIPGSWSDMAAASASDRPGHTCLVNAVTEQVECRGATNDEFGASAVGAPNPTSSSVMVRYAGNFYADVVAAEGDIVTAPTAITAGDFHSCVLVDGWPHCWGAGLQLGSANRELRLWLAVPIPLPDPAVQLTASGTGLCARTSTGEVACWGDNPGERIVRPGAIPDRDEAHAATRVEGIAGARHVVLGASAACALLTDGNVTCWGETGRNAETFDAGIVPATDGGPALVTIDDVTQLDMNGFHACALRRDGSVWCWGESIAGATGFIGTDDTCDLPPCQPTPREVMGIDGEVVELATGGFANVGIPGFTCARLADGGVSCWGSNVSGALGQGTLGDPADPTAGDPVTPMRVPGIDDAIKIRAAGPGVCVLRSSGSMACWGGDVGGTLGTRALMSCGAFDCSPNPVEVQAVRDVVDFSMALTRTCATTSDGRVWCYGGEGFAEALPDTGPIPRAPVSGIAFPSELSAALDGHCAVVAGDVLCWGDAGRSTVAQGREFDAVIDPTAIVGM